MLPRAPPPPSVLLSCLAGLIVCEACGAGPASSPGAALRAEATVEETPASGPVRRAALQPCDPQAHMPHCLCDEDADCAERPGGECHVTSVPSGQNPGIVQHCFYPACEGDADCGPGRACVGPHVISPVRACMVSECEPGAACTDGTRTGTCLGLPGARGVWENRCVYAGHDCEGGCSGVDPAAPDTPPQPSSCVFVGGEPRCQAIAMPP